MRLSNNLMYQNGTDKILENQQRVADAQERVNTGKKYLSSSEAPAIISQAMLFNDKIQINEQHVKNSEMLKSRLETQEGVLESIKESVDRANILTIKAGNGAMSDIDRKSMAGEIESIKEAVFSWMNAKSENGRYIFSGYQDNAQTYSFNSNTNTYEYNGDQGQHRIKVADGVEIKSSDNGYEVFEKAQKRLNIERSSVTPAGADVYVGEQPIFDRFHQDNYNADPNAAANANLITVNFTSATDYDLLQGGVTIQSGTYSGSNLSISGLDIDVPNTVPGSISFELEEPKKENLLNSLNKLSVALSDNSLSNADFKEVLSNTLVGLTNSKNLISQTQASLGARFNTADRIASSNLTSDINNKQAKAKLIEVDMAEAISDLTKQESSLQASQATFGRLANLSLFDYL
ncbi:flagellar hook-associated protein FlgL [Pseudoalteromonas sp. HL-AS1]|uniref:flagellar hook-associated protein FlgL n=1 Tax=Pseudoalteromonas sp. HL-AS1 TaxID=3071081 RepID=UPI0028162EDD|nr:flagellar hook-associated protein FlgL [Pseudoalteromonas sp. HL-AS1]WMS89961.1 flagellar hook-associated protein FlgL [Pseudoalteromonas sp. HL-AS1]